MKIYVLWSSKYELEIQTKNTDTHSLICDNPELEKKIHDVVQEAIKSHVAQKDSKTA